MKFNYFFAAILIFACIYCCRSENEDCLNADEDGTCLESCPTGTFVYSPGCEDITMSQQTCRQPEARTLGYICDYTRCDCLEHKFWDEAAKQCVELDECSDQYSVDDEDKALT